MSKYRLIQRNFNSQPDSQTTVVDFNTADELKDVDFVKQWVSQPEFVRLSLSQTALMIETNAVTLGIAFIKNLEGNPTDLSGLGLPLWKPPPPKPPVR